MNALINYCDAIKQSASASRRRVFVVETQGGRSGYIATITSLAIGALAVYTNEEGINLQMLSRDIQFLRDSFAKDQGQGRGGKLILRNENASETYTTQVIADMIREESKGRFESRFAIPGHVQQGGTPSPMDRVRAVRLAVKCIQAIEEYAGMSKEAVGADELSMAVIGIKGAGVVFGGMERLEREETNVSSCIFFPLDPFAKSNEEICFASKDYLRLTARDANLPLSFSSGGIGGPKMRAGCNSKRPSISSVADRSRRTAAPSVAN